MSLRKKFGLVSISLLVIAQFFQPRRNSSGESQGDVITNLSVPTSVAKVLREACYDCHSNNTRYPWYSSIQPLGWILSSHIKNGKNDLNFSQFAQYSHRRQLSKLKAIQTSIKEGTMPLASYTLMHKNAKLSEVEKKLIVDWAQSVLDTLENKRQRDSGE